MRFYARQTLDLRDEVVRYHGTPELLRDLGVIDRTIGAARDIPRRNHLVWKSHGVGVGAG